MAQRLDSFPSATNRRYPWEDWLDGGVWKLVFGEDYLAKTQTVVSAARNKAKQMDGSVRTRILEEAGRDTIILQFYRVNT